MRKKILYFLLLATFPSAYAQQEYATSHIAPELLQNADAVIRSIHQKTVIEDLNKVVTYTTRVITIFNEQGENFIDAYEYYSDGDKVEDQEALILDSAGNEIKKIKQKDFNDVSAYGSSTLFSDSRVSFLDYTARRYPYTVVYTSEFERENSVFLDSWHPVEGYDISIEKAVFELENPQNFPIRHKELNLKGYDISRSNSNGNFNYSVKNIPARRSEPLSPDLNNTIPKVLFSLDVFELEGVRGKTVDWKQFGKWMHDNLVQGHDELPASTVTEITSLTKDAETLEEKARIIYQYVQDKTRYISVQYGIGGWKPENATSVDQLGYGDCKALTNYTKALLKTQGIDSFYTVIYGGAKRNISPDFALMQGNHVILNIPRKDSTDIWLECTSQKAPFNYLGDFTDDRYALRVSNDGGEIIKTKKYDAEENLQQIECLLQLNENGGFHAEFTRASFGVPYGDKYYLADKDEDELKEHYRNSWARFQNLKFGNIELENDRNNIKFQEKLKFSGDRLATNAGNRLLIPLNFIQQQSLNIRATSERTMPLHVSRGKTYKDHFIFQLPEGFEIEALPESQNIASDFGEFSIKITALEDENSAIEIERLLVIKEGEWPKDRFDEFQLFLGMVSRLNNLKAVIVNNAKS
ncbi:DUF3857 domain-containing protein [Christiangramia sp. SM2212]|uniref:DUF3857 domain-containing protein n=1 Tax=Christiangramia sediminicola TaxID=3073267 RepID=A0ABU1EMA7_9FLAO|nr:DUF3857 domain-containing protein [Christiangramia sp. SM2212]MDR5589520.1 DUF3857 domain-containing protein [Christiangramia sp. SM2212]